LAGPNKAERIVMKGNERGRRKEPRKGKKENKEGKTDVQTIHSSLLSIYQIQSTRFKIHDP
jgi:hypothetical protein